MPFIDPNTNGSCADCGDAVSSSEPILRVAEGQYVCASCFSTYCVSCGAPDATTRYNHEDGESEPLCPACWYTHDHRAGELYGEVQAAWAETMIELFKEER
jgi:formylmethanofuran dehydrogenase subunit E